MDTLARDRPAGSFACDDGVFFRVWAPAANRVEVVVAQDQTSADLDPASEGYFEALVPALRPGTLYKYRLSGKQSFPDPCSRFQPDGPHGPSMVVDADAFRWGDRGWRGVRMKGQVLYELHIGTFTPEGTFDAAIGQLAQLRALGVTLIEVMPVAEFPGRWNWGYDGVALYAPYHGYGDCQAFKRFVDSAHQLGLGVILDVVYNHLGPDGNYLRHYSPHYFSDRYQGEWGDPFNFDGAHSGPVRDYVVQNACYWIRDFHLDGLRLDATQSVFDQSERHVLAELAQCVRATAAPRGVILIAENEPQHTHHLRTPQAGGLGLDAMWADDYHHSARVALCGRHEGYFHDHRGTPQELISAAKRGFLFQGQQYLWQQKPRGEPVADEPAWAFVFFLQNHDQIANTLWGERLHRLASPARLRALTALTLLAPETPLLFMGEEFAASARFAFFADHKPELAASILKGRRKFVRQFESYSGAAAQASIGNPADEALFLSCKLNPAERELHAQTYALYKDLLRIRREDSAISRQDRFALDGAVLDTDALALRWFAPDGDRLLLVNLGGQIDCAPMPEPLLAPPRECRWQMLWDSEHPRYGGLGERCPITESGLQLQAECAVLLAPSECAVLLAPSECAGEKP